MLLKTEGVILRSVKYGETSLILEAYTAAKGRQSYIINGVRSAKARTRQSVVAVASLVELVVYHRDGKGLNRIKEVKPACVYRSIPFDVAKGAVALFLAELIGKTIREPEENPMLFDFIVNSIVSLDEADSAILFPLAFSILLMPHLGFPPGNDWAEARPYFDLREGLFVPSPPARLFMAPDEARAFAQLSEVDISNMGGLCFPYPVREKLLDDLLAYYRYHLDGFKELNAHLVLREVLGG